MESEHSGMTFELFSYSFILNNSVKVSQCIHSPFIHFYIGNLMENALNQPERGDLQIAQVQTYLSMEIDPSNNSLRFTHNQSVEKLLATTRLGWNTQKHNTHFTNHVYGERAYRGMNCYIGEPNNSVRHAHSISFLHWKITLKNALNQPEHGDLLATVLSGSHITSHITRVWRNS